MGLESFLILRRGCVVVAVAIGRMKAWSGCFCSALLHRRQTNGDCADAIAAAVDR